MDWVASPTGHCAALSKNEGDSVRNTIRIPRAAAAWLAALAASAAIAQNAPAPAPYPNKPVRLLVGYAAGGGTDVIARIVSQALGTRWSQQVVVENKAGASGMIAAEMAARSTPDGYTLLLAYTPEVSINKLIFKQMSYDPLTDLQPVALVAQAPLFLVSGPKLPIQSMKDLLARGKGGEPLSYGSPGTGGQQHLAGELLQIQGNVRTLHIPYKGAAPAVNDLLGGQLDVFFSSPPVILPHVRTGKLKPLFVTSPQRSPLMPDVPSAPEVGLPAFDISNWFGVFVPKGVDPAVVQKVEADLKAVLSDPTVVKRLEDQGLSARFMGAADLRAFITAEMTKYGEIIDKSGLSRQ
jgi:tripartite-type tricarboxylate transporter receptor subunit TctC